MSIMGSPPAWTYSTGMLSTPADFPVFSALTAASISSRRIGRCSSSGIYGQSSTVGSPSVSYFFFFFFLHFLVLWDCRVQHLFENRVALNPGLGGVRNVASAIIFYEQTQ